MQVLIAILGFVVVLALATVIWLLVKKPADTGPVVRSAVDVEKGAEDKAAAAAPAVVEKAAAENKTAAAQIKTVASFLRGKK